MRSLDVGIIGCGTAGSAAAVFLARAGHKVTLYERVLSPSAIGAGITVQPSGLHVLARLGLHDQILARGARVDHLHCVNRKGRTVLELTYETAGEGLFGVGLHRGVLFEALLGAACLERNVTLLTGVEIVDLAREDARWKCLVDVDRVKHGPHELIVVADGARSQLRDDTSTSKRVVPYPWGALWFVGKTACRSRTLRQIVDGTSRFLGLLPTGRLPLSHESPLVPSSELVSLFWSIRCDRVAAWRTGGLEKWKDEARALAPEAEPVLEQIDDENQMLFASYHDVVMHRWHTRNVVYLGDAAHAMSPQLGQGCNLALWDAMELGDCLATEERDLARALEHYSRCREDHLAFYQIATRWLTPLFQGDLPVGDARDLLFSTMAKLPLFKRLMTLGMLGVTKGFLGETLTLRLPSD